MKTKISFGVILSVLFGVLALHATAAEAMPFHVLASKYAAVHEEISLEVLQGIHLGRCFYSDFSEPDGMLLATRVADLVTSANSGPLFPETHRPVPQMTLIETKLGGVQTPTEDSDQVTPEAIDRAWRKVGLKRVRLKISDGIAESETLSVKRYTTDGSKKDGTDVLEVKRSADGMFFAKRSFKTESETQVFQYCYFWKKLF